jgi:hypothetical protein
MISQERGLHPERHAKNPFEEMVRRNSVHEVRTLSAVIIIGAKNTSDFGKRII